MEQDDLAMPSNADDNLLVVGIGASAGGISALRNFFIQVPEKTGISFIVILHLSPDHDSQLAAILQTVSKIPVLQVTERVQLRADHVYVIPPNRHLVMNDGHVEVLPNLQLEDRRAPVDIFFRTLAESHGRMAACAVLSGTGANGSMGLKRIKENGGAAFAQDPEEAEFKEMPLHSIDTGFVDEILPVSEIPARIILYKQNIGKITLPVATSKEQDVKQALRLIFSELHKHTGHDFSDYKRATILRRIERRINVCNLEDLPAYAAFLQQNTKELQSLLKDLLISVTNFFRDKAAFEFIDQQVLPKIFAGKGAGSFVRIWVAGCATGEEAYSIAMLCAEKTHLLDAPPKVQIFATDIDESAIAHARDGYYTLNDAADVPPALLRDYFAKDGDGYRIKREIREMILFAGHRLTKRPAILPHRFYLLPQCADLS